MQKRESFVWRRHTMQPNLFTTSYTTVWVITQWGILSHQICPLKLKGRVHRRNGSMKNIWVHYKCAHYLFEIQNTTTPNKSCPFVIGHGIVMPTKKNSKRIHTQREKMTDSEWDLRDSDTPMSSSSLLSIQLSSIAKHA